MRRNFHLTDADANEAVETLKGRGRVLPGLYEGVTAIQDDVSDNVLLAAALEAGADYLVTQDPLLAKPRVLPRYPDYLAGAVYPVIRIGMTA